MAWQFWVIIILIGFNWYTYTYPDQAAKLVGPPLWDKVNGFVSNNNILNKPGSTTEETVADDGCPDIINQVCGEDGVTYDNTCKAAMADVFKVTSGAC